MKIAVAALFICLASSSVSAQIYKCNENGQVVFSGTPCSNGKNDTIKVKPASGSIGTPTQLPAAQLPDQTQNVPPSSPDKYKQQTDDINKRLAKENEERKARREEYEKERTPETLANNCFDTARGDLLDSKGAYVVRWQHDNKSRYHKIKVEGRVKTRGGGFSEYYVYCNIDIDGKTMKKAYAGKNENLESIEWRF